MKFAGKVVLGTIIAIIVVILLIAGCSALVLSSDEGEALTDQPGVVQVKAPPERCWSGAIGSATRDGCGNQEFEITDEPVIVANAQKQTEGKWKLELVLLVDGEEVDREQTTAEFGVAMVSE